MTVVVDTGPLIGFVHSDDPYHERAKTLIARILRGEWGLPIILDHVIAEGLTFLRKRANNRATSDEFLALAFGGARRPIGQVVVTSLEDFREATRMHFKHFERGLSLTDCAVALRAAQVRGVVATFEKGFDGIVATVKE